jgi:hypothetical protein
VLGRDPLVAGDIPCPAGEADDLEIDGRVRQRVAVAIVVIALLVAPGV